MDIIDNRPPLEAYLNELEQIANLANAACPHITWMAIILGITSSMAGAFSQTWLFPAIRAVYLDLEKLDLASWVLLRHLLKKKLLTLLVKMADNTLMADYICSVHSPALTLDG